MTREAGAGRAAIVAWLRERARSYGHGERVFAADNVRLCAAAIERLDHHQPVRAEENDDDERTG